MAENWIKVEKVTPGKPEVLGIASALEIHPVQAFGFCVLFWMWCDDQLTDGNATSVTHDVLDYHIGCNGFASALVNVGWLRDRSGSLEVPHFERHLSSSAKTRARTAERVKKSRAKQVTKLKQECNAESVTPSLSNSLFQEFDFEGSFARFWKVYPSKGGKKEARKAWEKAIVRTAKESDVETANEKIILAAQEYARFLKSVPNPPTPKWAQGWLNNDRFEDDYTEMAASYGAQSVSAGQSFDPNAKFGEGF